MKIPFDCPNCGAQYQIDEKHVGDKGKCTKCGTVIEVPEARDAAFDDTGEIELTKPVNKIQIIVLIALVLALILLLGFFC
jgi:predicted Zn finger-like uncharacterized protein